MENKLESKILFLRSQGLTYNKIVEELGCSKGAVSYHCGKGQKKKQAVRGSLNRRTTKNKIYRKIHSFIERDDNRSSTYVKRTPAWEDYYNKIVNKPYCYLTGEFIDLSDQASYSLDHIIPYSISQDNSVNNMGLCKRIVNQSKSSMTVEEYLELCKEVLEFKGYTIS